MLQRALPGSPNLPHTMQGLGNFILCLPIRCHGRLRVRCGIVCAVFPHIFRRGFCLVQAHLFDGLLAVWCRRVCSSNYKLALIMSVPQWHVLVNVPAGILMVVVDLLPQLGQMKSMTCVRKCRRCFVVAPTVISLQ